MKLTFIKYMKYLTILISIIFFSCNKVKEKTDVTVIDPNRHYLPIVQGDKLKLTYQIKNTGNHLLEIDDILLSCGCIIINSGTTYAIPPKSTGLISLEYNSNKNTGLVKHQIYLYGNFNNSKQLELKFDVNIVPNSMYTRDYEEVSFEEGKKDDDLFSTHKKETKLYYVD